MQSRCVLFKRCVSGPVSWFRCHWDPPRQLRERGTNSHCHRMIHQSETKGDQSLNRRNESPHTFMDSGVFSPNLQQALVSFWPTESSFQEKGIEIRHEQSQPQACNAEPRIHFWLWTLPPAPHPAYTPPPNTDQRPSGFSHWMSKQLKEYRQAFRPRVRASMMQAVLLFLSSFFFLDSVKISDFFLSLQHSKLTPWQRVYFYLLYWLLCTHFFFSLQNGIEALTGTSINSSLALQDDLCFHLLHCFLSNAPSLGFHLISSHYSRSSFHLLLSRL